MKNNMKRRLTRITYHHNDKIKPAPGIGEIFGKPERKPLQKHLKEKYHCEEFINVAEIFHEDWIPLEVDIF